MHLKRIVALLCLKKLVKNDISKCFQLILHGFNATLPLIKNRLFLPLRRPWVTHYSPINSIVAPLWILNGDLSGSRNKIFMSYMIFFHIRRWLGYTRPAFSILVRWNTSSTIQKTAQSFTEISMTVAILVSKL